MRLSVIAVVVSFAMLANLFPGFSIVCEAQTLRFSAPVNARIVKKFVPPLGPYGPGHRGIDFGVPAGTQVRAAGDGVVTFAGAVGGDGLFVTVRHDPVLETTYSFLSELAVQRGQRVSRGTAVGLSGAGHAGEAPSLHFGAKVNGQYIDPELLLFGDPKDISDALALAPFPHEAGGGGGGASGGAGGIGGARGGGVPPFGSIVAAALVPLERIGEVLIAAPGAIKEVLSDLGSWMRKLPGRLASGAVAAFAMIKVGLIRGFDAIKSLGPLLLRLLTVTKSLALTLWSLTKLAIKSVAGILQRLPRQTASFLKLVLDRIREGAVAQWRLFKATFRIAVRIVRNVPSALRAQAVSLWRLTKQITTTAATVATSALRSLVQGTQSLARTVLSALRVGAARAVGGARSFLAGMWRAFQTGASFSWKAAPAFALLALSSAKSLASSAWWTAKAFAVSAWSFLKSSASLAWRLAKTIAINGARFGKALALQVWRIGSSAIRGLIGLVSAGIRAGIAAARSVFGLVGNMSRQLIRTLLGGADRLIRIFGQVLAPLAGWLTNLFDRGGRVAKALLDLVKPLVATPFVIAGAAIKQMKCEIKGGAKPPALAGPGNRRRKPPPPPNDHIVVAVAGIGSSTHVKDGEIRSTASMYEFDFASLGYKKDQTYLYSYKGLEAAATDGKSRIHAPYQRSNTFQPIEESARLLALQIDEIRRRNPGKKVDIVAHSQGGVVAQYYITRMYRKQKGDEAFLGAFVSISSPHLGADGAQFGADLKATPRGRLMAPGIDYLALRAGLPPPGAPSSMQLAENSAFMRRLNRDWDPSKVKTTTIAAAFDYVVTSPHTRLRGANHYTADLRGFLSALDSHGNVVDALSTRQFVYNSLRGTPSKCTGFSDVMADRGPGQVISGAQDLLLSSNSLGMHLAGVGP